MDRYRREPGFNFGGTPAEDMQYGDRPAKSAAIMVDPMFLHPDELLGRYLRQLLESLSMGRMEAVAVAIQQQFCGGGGGEFHSATLDAEVAATPPSRPIAPGSNRRCGKRCARPSSTRGG